MARTHTTKPARLLKRARRHIRIDLGTDDEVTQLGYAYLARPIYPIIVTPELEILDGHRRHEGVMRVDPDAEVPVCITDEAMGEAISPATLLEIQIESAQHTRGLSDYELFGAYTEWLALHPEATAKNLAARFLRDQSIVSKILSLRNCIDAVKEAARAGLIGYTVWHQLSKLTPDQQAAELAEGTTREKAKERRRHQSNGTGGHATKPGADRPKRIRIPVASDAASGIVALDLPEGGELSAAEALLKEAEKALRLPRIRITPAKDDAPGTVAVARNGNDTQAEALLKEALKLVQEAKSNKLALKTALNDWQDKAAAAHDAKATPGSEPAAPEMTQATPAA